MKTAFLDANVLFSAAYREESRLAKQWELSEMRLCTSPYAVEEAKRNLRHPEREARLERLVGRMQLVPEADGRLIPSRIVLAEKNRPILAAAIAARANFLVTGDAKDFGCYYGKRVAGVLVIRPNDLCRKMP
ncbi:MAG: PIN domain-containing protein [Verrucomicrobiales bacterium]|nr:PIN domain-containing protein [Verrucomicrobiales bacterium]